MATKVKEVKPTDLTSSARAEMVHDAQEATKIAADSYVHGQNQISPDAVFAELRLERRLAAVNPNRKVFEE